MKLEILELERTVARQDLVAVSPFASPQTELFRGSASIRDIQKHMNTKLHIDATVHFFCFLILDVFLFTK